MSKRVSKKELVLLNDGLFARRVMPWFKEKHRLLYEYVKMFAGPRRAFPSSFFLDLYCDYGKCVDQETGQAHDGSTLVALKAMQEAGASFSRVYVNDLKREAVEACASRCSAEGFEVIALNLDAKDAVDEVARRERGRGLNLAFLDPFSLGSLPFSIFQQLSQIGKTDMMVHVSIYDLRRNFAHFTREMLDGLDRFAPDWRDHYDPNASIDTNQRAVIDHWSQMLYDRGYLETKRWKNMPDSGPLLYRLVLLAKEETALRFWNGALDANPQRRLF